MKTHLQLFSNKVKKYFTLGIIILIYIIGIGSTAYCQSTNIAPGGTGVRWSDLVASTDTTTQEALPGINDGDITVNLDLWPDVAGPSHYSGVGVIWSTAMSGITSVKFYNGTYNSGSGNGYFEADIRLQSSTDGLTWKNVVWPQSSPIYPYSEAASDQIYTYTGSALNNIMGIRIVGQNRLSETVGSWHNIVKELEVFGTASTTSTSVIDNNSALVYPNPTSGMVNIQVEGHSMISIFTLEGKLLVNKQVEQGTTRFPLHLNKGLYLIRVVGEKAKIYSGKLVVN